MTHLPNLKSGLTGLLLVLPLFVGAQKTTSTMHSISELAEIMEKSKLTYSLNLELDETVECEEHKQLNEAFTFTKKKGDNVSQAAYEISDAGTKAMRRAETHFEANNYDSARFYYEKFTRLHPEISTGWDFLAQTYEIEKDYKTAIKYLRKAIDLNYYDYLAHYFIADDYFRTGEMEKALDEIVIASILNRNNQNILNSMRRIFPAAGLELREWCFQPQIQLSTGEEGQIDIKAGPNWVGFGIARAIWEYEPGYRTKYGPEEGSYNLNEDRECLAALALLITADTAKGYKSEPALVGLVKATKNEMFQEYVLYEMALPKYPSVVFQLDKSALEDLRKYVIAVHGRKKENG